ncbi:hypothetical protein E4U55_006108 [Claviceps digitariae]|nr:hypothetical protein E4U55_006108 [Claviceps digitariae]
MAFMDEHEKFLTDRLFSEKRPITYRHLSKALDIHVNTAKGLLFQFYQSQSLQCKSTIRATYLIYGTLVPSSLAEDDDEDTEPSSQPSESLQPARQSKLMLVEEEKQLHSYQSVSSIHIYGLSPNGVGNPWSQEFLCQSSSEAARHGAENNATVGKNGTIVSSRVRIRERNTALKVPSSRTVTLTSSAEQADDAKKLPKPSSIPHEKPQSQSRKPAPATSSDRKASGNIFQSFAKSAAKAQAKASEPAKPEKTENDSAMALSDDGEAGDSDVLSTKVQPPQRSRAKTRTQREEVLRRMMEEEEEDDDADKYDAEDGSADDHQMEETMDFEPEPEAKAEAEAEAEAPPDSAMSGCDGLSETVSSVTNGRRRGKRRVMQKKRILDDQGYMVTIQEPGWESFSEDDTPQPPSKKPTPASAPSSSAKSKKSNGKAVQGSIMSFFNKK